MEQAHGIDQVNIAVSEMDMVMQRNKKVSVGRNTKEIRPDQVISFDEDDSEDF